MIKERKSTGRHPHKQYTDGSLYGMTKWELIDQIRCLENNLYNCDEELAWSEFLVNNLVDTYKVPNERLSKLSDTFYGDTGGLIVCQVEH